jgi:hypothetical protein
MVYYLPRVNMQTVNSVNHGRLFYHVRASASAATAHDEQAHRDAVFSACWWSYLFQVFKFEQNISCV